MRKHVAKPVFIKGSSQICFHFFNRKRVLPILSSKHTFLIALIVCYYLFLLLRVKAQNEGGMAVKTLFKLFNFFYLSIMYIGEQLLFLLNR